MVNAKFIADYTNFEAATRAAVVTLKTFDSQSKTVERNLGRMTDSFSGRKLIQEATLMTEAIERIGGKSKLTESELISVGNKAAEAAEKMRRLGIDVPPKLDALAKSAQKPVGVFNDMLGVIGKIGPALGVGLSIGTVTSFAKGVGEFAGKMVDLNAQTQISTTRLQALNYAGAGAGLTIDDIAASADQLSKRLGGDDKSVNEALARLNLSASELKNLSLDEVIFQIDEGLKGVGNQFERSRILADLFGKSGAQLGRLLDGGLKEAITSIEKTGAIIDEQLLKKADEFDDAWSQAWIKFRAYSATAVGFAIDQLSKLGPVITDVGAALREDRTSNFGVPSSGGSVITPRDGPRARAPRRIGIDSTAPDIVFGGGLKEILAREEADKDAAEAAKAFAEATKKGAAATEAWVREMHNARGQMLMNQDAALLNSPTSEATKKLRDLTMRAGLNGILPSSRLDVAGMFGLPGAVSNRNDGAGFGLLAKRPQSFLGGLKGGFGDLISGFTGGNGTGGFLSNLGGSLVGGIGNALGGALTGGISSLIGFGVQGLGKLFGGLFGAEGKKTNRARDTAISDVTGITGDKGASQAKFREMATAAGVATAELDKLFSTKRTKDFETTMDSITKEIEKQAAIVEKYGVTWQDLSGDAMTSGLNDAVKTLTGDFDALTRAGLTHEAAVEKVGSAYVDLAIKAVKAGQDIPAALAPTIAELAKMGRITDEQARALLGLSDAAAVDFQRMEDVAKKYGIELSALGPKFQEAKLGFSANETIKDFKFLIDAGADVNGVLAGMTDELQALVKQSIDFGIALPDSMRPVLQKLIEQGKLTDASGTKLEDLTQIKFAAPIEDSVQRLIDKMGELIDRIGGVGTALGGLSTAVPDVPSGIWNWNGERPSEIPGMPGFKTGTSGRYLDFGSGTAVMLHGRERVSTEAEGAAQAGAWSSLVAEMRGVRSDLGWMKTTLPIAMRDAVLLSR